MISPFGIIYFDSYGNAITNLKKSKFLNMIDSSRFVISLVSEHNQMKKIAKSYLDARPGEILSIFNSQNLLEIAIREGNIKQLLDLNIGDQIRIEVIEK
jgi:S-adenosylmethionine hydrolase